MASNGDPTAMQRRRAPIAAIEPTLPPNLPHLLALRVWLDERISVVPVPPPETSPAVNSGGSMPSPAPVRLTGGVSLTP
jgi:hypothetical protein